MVFRVIWMQMGYQIWKSTEPILLQFSLEFYYTYDAHIEVVKPINLLCRLPLPDVGKDKGNLVPLGPSVLEAIAGTKESNMPPSGEAPAPSEIEEEVTKKSANSYVNIRVGNMTFMGCIIESAEPTFSKYVDEDNYPIYGKVVMRAMTMYTATKEDIDRIMGMV